MSGQDARVRAVLVSADAQAARRVQNAGTRAQRLVNEAIDTAAALDDHARLEEATLAVAAGSVIWAIGRKWSKPVEEHGVLASMLDRLESAIKALREVGGV